MFRIRTGILGYPAEVRAKEISRRLEMLAKDYTFSPESIAVSEGPLGTEILAGDRFILNVQDADAPAGKTRYELAKEYAGTVRKAVVQYRIDYSKKQIVRGSALAILTTLILVFLIRIVMKIYGKILARFQARAVERYGKILEDTRGKRILDSIGAVLSFLRLILIVSLFVIYLQIVLGLLPWTHPFAGRITGYILIPLRSLALGFVSEIPDLFFVAILTTIVYYVLKVISIFSNLIEDRRITIRGFEPEGTNQHITLFEL